MKNNSKPNLDYRNDFPFFKANPGLVFLDSAATSLKPKKVIDMVNKYYQHYSINIHSIDYPLAIETKNTYESCREVVSRFINCESKEVIFCSGATFAFNQLAYSLEQYLQPGDEIVLTNCEHGSLLLPFYRLVKDKKLVLKFVEVESDGLITTEKLAKVLSGKTRVVAFANMNNSLGTINDVEELTKFIKSFLPLPIDEKLWPFKNIFVAIDGAQAAIHVKTDIKKWGVDFFAFAGHKVLGPTGVGVWWAKYEWLKILRPLILGGGMNGRIYQDGTFTYLDPPYCLEAGTPHIAGVLGLKTALEYLLEIGMDTLHQHEKELKKYAVEQFKLHLSDKVTIYNANYEIGTLLFNVKNVFAEDVANYLGTKNICLRSGNFCAKLLSNVINCASTLRASFLIYNNKRDVDQLVSVLKQGLADNGDFLDGFFGTKK